jgi:hypothetical protein
MEKISKTELVKTLSKTKGQVCISFVKKNGSDRVITGKLCNENQLIDDQGYIQMVEVLTSNIKRVDPRTLKGAIINGKELICK